MTTTENDRQYNIYFTLNDSANVTMNNIDSVIKQIAAACGIEEKNVIVNDLYLQLVLQHKMPRWYTHPDHIGFR